MLRPSSFALPLLLLGVLGARASTAHACAPFTPSQQVRAVDEAALVLYDEASQTERFIRRASFDTRAVQGEPLAFLVPTPSQPTLAEADPRVFAALDARLQQHLDAQADAANARSGGAGCGPWAGSSHKGLDAARGSVEVLEEARVAGHDAAVLRASDSDALAEWLRAHGFGLPAHVAEYLQGYVAAGWYVTAFRYQPSEAPAAQLDTRAIELSFRTPRAVYPYREPSGSPQGGARSLRIYALAGSAVRGRLDTAGRCVDANGARCDRPWQGELLWSTALDAPLRAELAPLGELPSGTVLSLYDDVSNPRDGELDLYFEAAPELLSPTQQPLRRVHLGLGAVLGLLGLGAWRRGHAARRSR